VKSPFYRLECRRPQSVKRSLLKPLEVTLSAPHGIENCRFHFGSIVVRQACNTQLGGYPRCLQRSSHQANRVGIVWGSSKGHAATLSAVHERAVRRIRNSGRLVSVDVNCPRKAHTQ
jgi:hypothetical protein